MNRTVLAIVLIAGTGAPLAQAPSPPTLEAVRKGMGIPTQSLALRGQKDAVGFASQPGQMAKVFELSQSSQGIEEWGPFPVAGTVAALCPHDDYIYAGPVYRRVLPGVSARTVVLIGVFHAYRAFGVRGKLVFEPYTAWRTPEGPLLISSLREDLLTALAPEDWIQDAAMHDGEHSLEAIAYWLKYLKPDREIVPIIVPVGSFERLEELGEHLGRALGKALQRKGWELGRDLAIVISTDGIHYGPDFRHVPFGEGGVEVYRQAVERDRALLTGPLSGPLTRDKISALFQTFVDPNRPDDYRVTWCGRFAIPFGLMTLRSLGQTLDLGEPWGQPVAYATSVGSPQLAVQDLGLGATAPANLFHFVGYPAAVFGFLPSGAGKKE